MKPSAAQIEAGNYPKEHVTAHGMRVSIENAKGSTRSGVSKTGKRWSNKMEHDYGYIRGTSGRDGDHIDVFLGPHHADPSVPVHVVDQVDPDTGDFDEHKVMLGFKTEDDAIDAYHANYEAGWQGMKAVTPLSMDKFKAWAFTDGTRMKPVSEHSVSADEIRAFATGGSVTDGGAFIGYKSAGKRKPEHNDRVAAADMPFQAARGWAAGTAGLPGDIESLTRAFIRMLGSEGSPAANVSERATLPTSEFYKEWLPGAPTGASGKAAGEVGSLFGGAGAGSVARGTAKAGKFAAKGAAEQIAKGLEGQGALSSVLSPAAPMYAVKPKGGNWLPDRVDHYLDDITSLEPGTDASNWMQSKARKYIRNDLGTATDPLLQLEKEGRLHLAPEDLEHRARNFGEHPYGARLPDGAHRFELAGTARDKFHSDATGRDYRTAWENLADGQVHSMDPKTATAEAFTNYLPNAGHDPRSVAEGLSMMDEAGVYDSDDVTDLGSRLSWLDKLKPDAKVHDLRDANEDALGLGHINDYLNAATRAHEIRATTTPHNYRLPAFEADRALVDAGLHLSPEQLSRSSFADIVAKTGEWNKLLAKGSALTDYNKGVKQVHKTYDTGHQWVELDPEGLGAEGKAMGHCVGGYCSQVEDGSARILSLRDKAGKPITTVEVAPGSPLRGSSNSGPSIRQIKGRFNQAPPEDAVPHIQDLVRNGLGDGLKDWGAVGDLNNAKLLNMEGNSPVPGQRWLTAEELKDAMPQADIPDDMLGAGGFKAGGAVRRFNDGGDTGNSDGSSGGVDNGSQDGASGSLGGGSDSSVQDGVSGITNTAGYADRQGVTGANTDSSTNVGSSSFGMGEGLSFDHMLEALANEQAINGITNTAGYAQRQGVTGANTNQSTNPNSSSGGTGPGINTGQSFSSSPLGGVLGFFGNLGLNTATGGAYGMANTLTGAATGQSLTSRALDALSAAFDSPTPGPSPDGTQEVGPGLPGGSVNDSGGLNYAINPVNNPGALSGLYTPAPLNTGTPAWADPLAVAGHALRVYDPVFTPGNPTV